MPRIVATIPVGQSPQAVIYVPRTAPAGTSRAGLTPLEAGAPARVFRFEAPAPGAARGTVVVRTIGLVDQLQLSFAGLEPGRV